MEKINLTTEQLALLKTGNAITTDECTTYFNYPYWIKILGYPDQGITKCEKYRKSELPIKKGYKKGGLQKSKYIISKDDGSDVDPDAWYFVLRVDKDPHAQKAAIVYAQSVEEDNPLLAKELMEQVRLYE